MRITKMEEEPIERVPYLAAGAGGKGVIASWLPIFPSARAKYWSFYAGIYLLIHKKEEAAAIPRPSGSLFAMNSNMSVA